MPVDWGELEKIMNFVSRLFTSRRLLNVLSDKKKLLSSLYYQP
jgi:hypothetical protein